MKILPPLFLTLLFSLSPASGEKVEKEPVSASDLSMMLGFPGFRQLIEFDASQELNLRITVAESTQDVPLGKHRSLSLLLYSPVKSAGPNSIGYIIRFEDGSVFSSQFEGPGPKMKGNNQTFSGLRDGRYSLVCSSSKNSSEVFYKLEIFPKTSTD